MEKMYFLILINSIFISGCANNDAKILLSDIIGSGNKIEIGIDGKLQIMVDNTSKVILHGNKKILGEVNSKNKTRSYQYVKNHRIKLIYDKDKLENWYALYTYLILPRKVSISSRSSLSIKYKELLTTIQEIGLEDENHNIVIKKFRNEKGLLIIPIIKGSSINIDNYDFKNSRKILKIIDDQIDGIELSNKFKNNEGPFIITTMQPLLKKNKLMYLMYLDMSNLRSTAIRQVISTYMLRLKSPNKGNRPFSFFEKTKVNILASLTNINADISEILSVVNIK